ncbi:MAG: sensor histidine kinase [Micropruina sp.]|uniref:sensor histidine kinase n=1 Tax=Micropruina sp. TaxID=2737536 RepID=UPI0039E51EFD
MNARELVFPPGATRHDWVMDGLLTLAMMTVTVLPFAIFSNWNSIPRLVLVPTLTLMVLPLLLRRHSPLLMLAGCTVAGIVQVIVVNTFTATLVVLPIVAYSVARWVSGRWARSVVVIGALGAVIGPLRWSSATEGFGISARAIVLFVLSAFVCLGLIVTPYAIGRRVRESTVAHADRIAAAEERYHLLLAEREQQARLAESRARATIARELHDIVAHSLSVMIVQAEGGRALATKRPDAAVAALDTIADTGREALSEMRRIVGVLRSEPERRGADWEPAPSLADIPELVHRASDRATLVVHGEPPRVSPALELTIYRVVQEALTNFLKHAGPTATAVVTLAYGATEIMVEIVDNGPGPEQVTTTPGHGLRGMAERVTSMDGRLEAHPLALGGFVVRAVLPVHNRQGAHR